MSGRHAQKRRRGSRTPLIAGGTIIALAVAGGFAALKLGDEAAGSSGNKDCNSTSTLTLAAPRELVPIVRSATTRLLETDPCTTFTIRDVPGTDVLSEIAQGSPPDVWIPESSQWVKSLNDTKPAREWNAGPSIVSSPVVVALPPTQAQRLKGAHPTWADLLQGTGATRLADPNIDTASRIALFSARSSMGTGQDAEKTVGALMIFLSRSAAATQGQLFYWYAENPAASPPFAASEQSLAAYNAAHTQSPLSAIIPAGGTGVMDYPFVTAPDLSSAAAKAANGLEKELTGTQAQQEAVRAGFRSADSTAVPAIEGITSGPVASAASLDGETETRLLRQWVTVRKDMRMLAVLDVSGSMKNQAGSTTRVELARQAADSAMNLLPGGSKVGAWAFSTHLDGATDYKPLVPVAGLQEIAGGKSQRQRLIDAANSWPKILGGDTGLYDTTLAAFRKMRAEYDPRYVNSVVVLTDGKNDDDSGITLQTLLATLKAENDPTKPVVIITIGMGPGTDASELKQIAEATGGTSYIAQTPEDMKNVFVTALLSRN